jgi:hypothetical protein
MLFFSRRLRSIVLQKGPQMGVSFNLREDMRCLLLILVLQVILRNSYNAFFLALFLAYFHFNVVFFKNVTTSLSFHGVGC